MNDNLTAYDYDHLALKAYYDDQDYLKAFKLGRMACNLDPSNEQLKSNLSYYQEKCAENHLGYSYVTLLTDNSYINGVIVLAESLKQVESKWPLACVITPDISEDNKELLRRLGIRIHERPIIHPNGTPLTDAPDVVVSLDDPGYHKALAKFHIWNLTEYEKLVYIDADIIVKANIDELFEKEHMSAVPDKQHLDYTLYDDASGSFCSGLVVIKPNAEEFNAIMDFFNNFDSHGKMIHDQWVLQEYYKDWKYQSSKHLDIWYCPWTSYFEWMPDDYYYRRNKIKTLHIIDRKPWVTTKQFYIDRAENYPCYAKLCLDYIDTLNWEIKKIKDRYPDLELPDLNIIE